MLMIPKSATTTPRSRAVLGVALLLVLVVGSLQAQSYDDLSGQAREFVSISSPEVVITGVRLVDGTGAPARENQRIHIKNGRFVAIGSDIEVPDSAERLDYDGHTVLPGLVGAHNHTFYTTPRRNSQMSTSGPRLYLACGLTTIRTTGSSAPYNELNLKRDIEDGLTVGPRMHLTGPYLTGPQNRASTMAELEDAEDARRIVAYWAEEGVTWFKAYTNISREALGAGIEEAHKRGLKFTGHLCSVGYREAVDLGIDSLEHGLFADSEFYSGKQPDECPPQYFNSLAELDIESDEVRGTIEHMVENDVAMTSTLAVYELYVPNRPPLEQRVLEALAPAAKEEYLTQRALVPGSEDGSAMLEIFPRAQAFELAFHRAGGLLVAGVDPTGSGGALPGFGDQRNYELLLEAGFTPLEVIRIMSLNGAKLLGVDEDLGSVEVGKVADLVIIDGDPLTAHAEIRNVVTVFKDGVGYDSAALIKSVRGMVGIR